MKIPVLEHKNENGEVAPALLAGRYAVTLMMRDRQLPIPEEDKGKLAAVWQPGCGIQWVHWGLWVDPFKARTPSTSRTLFDPAVFNWPGWVEAGACSGCAA